MSGTLTILAFNLGEAEHLVKELAQGRPVRFVHTVGSNPDAKLTKTDDRPNKGTRKWVTKYYVYQYDYKVVKADGTECYKGMKKVGEHDDKTGAVKEAREKAVETQQRHTVRIVKVLENSENIVADVEPKRNKQTFVFTVED